MNKKEFINELGKNLNHFPKKEKNKCLHYYEEMINDRIEDGMPEEMAVKAVGSIESIVVSVTNELSLMSLMTTKMNNAFSKKNNLVLILLGLPLWLPLLIAFIIVVLALYIVFISVIFSLYITLFAISVSGFLYAIFGFVFIFTNGLAIGLATIGSGIFAFSLALLLFKPGIALANLLLEGVKKSINSIKRLFINKEKNNENII